jgi:predicted nucleotidyltransferase
MTKFRTAEELMKENMLVKHFAGSLAYGTNLPTSDVDYRGVFCADPVNVRTPFFTVREATDTSQEDTKLFELAHFMKLCLDCNPNVVETLWVADKDIVFRTPAYDLLREHRHKLLSSKVAFTTSGYAIAQLKRIRGHNKWINNPQPEAKPHQKDFVSLVQWFGEEKVMPRDFVLPCEGHRLVPFDGHTYGLYPSPKHNTYSDDGSLNHQFDGDRQDLPPPLAVIKLNKDEWKNACEKHTNYWTWKNNRNETRSELEEEHGYDTKHAMHLVRLLRMGVEALRDEEIVVHRPDAQELLDIRNGSMTYEEVVEYAEEMDKAVREVWYKKTNLPKKPDIKFAAQLLMDVQDLVWING